ncbi:MAG TPA: DUF2851 family protein [Ferruginibacter sp.]|nr:DUF2851 family protein [Ferruginibacter sp.]
MTERLLQYIWQFQYFNAKELLTEEGECLQVIHPGTFNTNQGPDFAEGKIKIGETIWVGSIELHINSSDWKNHKHSHDSNYKNVILHVVWQHDKDLHLLFSTLILQDKVPKLLLKKYDELMNTGSFIPCEKNIRSVNELTWRSWKERLLVERLQVKTKLIFDQLQENNNHWEQTLWWLLARNFGAKLNSDAFEKIARSIPLGILARHKAQIHQVEALVFGQAGLLDKTFEEDYPRLLQREYRFLSNKYKLVQTQAPLVFLRMRPSNFPTIRLAQLAMLVNERLHLFSKIKESDDLEEIKELLSVTANDYWHYHYVFDETSPFSKKKLGQQMTNNILINTMIPIVFAYGQWHSENAYKDKALKWMEQAGAEKNEISRGFASLQLENKTAFDSQAFIQLKNEYCNKRRCLDCSIGNKLMRSDGAGYQMPEAG